MANNLSFLRPVSDSPNRPLLIFFPGMDGTGELLHKQIDGLKKSFNLRCLRIPKNNLDDWETLSKKAIALIKGELQPKCPVYLCGESFGSCLALSVAVQEPKLFQQLILINSASSFIQRPWLGWGIPITRSLPNFLYSLSHLAFLPFLIALDRVDSADREALLKAMRSVPSHVVSWRLYLLETFSLAKEKLKSLDLPVLIIACGSDRLLPSEAEARKLQEELPNAQLIFVPESGHACLLERDFHLNQVLNQHISLASITI